MKVLHLRTNSRIHCGLMELAADEPYRFGGLGVMITQPSLQIALSVQGSTSGATQTVCADSLDDAADLNAEVRADFERRIDAVIQQWRKLSPAGAGNGVHVQLLSALPLHFGYGAGTQLASSVAVGLELLARSTGHDPQRRGSAESQSYSPTWPDTIDSRTWQGVAETHPWLTPKWLSLHAGRGLRSAVGLVGFLHGGLVLDEGYTADFVHETFPSQSPRPLVAHTSKLPEDWRVVVVVPQHRAEVSGAQEMQVMNELSQHRNPHRERMLSLAHEAISQVEHHADFNHFTRCLDEYMELAAQLFCRYQGGMYNGAAVAEAVELARAAGLRGVGQSSWGPTVFGFAACQQIAEGASQRLVNHRPDWSVRITSLADRGAQFRWQDSVETSRNA